MCMFFCEIQSWSVVSLADLLPVGAAESLLKVVFPPSDEGLLTLMTSGCYCMYSYMHTHTEKNDSLGLLHLFKVSALLTIYMGWIEANQVEHY